MLRVHVHREGAGLELHDCPTIAAAWAMRGENPVWVDVEDPGPDEAQALAEVCGFHPLTVEDCLSAVQPPKVEEFGDYLFLVFRGLHPADAEGDLEPYKLAAYLGKSILVTVHRRPSAAITDVAALVTGRDLTMERHLDRVLHAIVDRMVDELTPIIDGFQDQLEGIEETIFEGARDVNPMRDLLQLKRNVLTIRRAAVPQREMLGRLARRDLPFIDEKTAIYFRDVYDHMARIEETTVILMDLASGAMEAQLSMASNRLNEIVKVLTIFSAIWMPLTFLAGVYGMNLKGMPEMEWRWFYPALWAVWVLIAGGMLAAFRARRWI